MMDNYPEALGQRPLEIGEAYQALEVYASTYGQEPLLLLMHAAVPETFRADLLNLIKQNFLVNHGADLSVEADVLFSPLVTDLGGGYYRIDAQVRWHCLGLLHSLYRNEVRTRQRRVAELLWRYVESMEQKATRTANPLFAEFLDIQRWVAFAFLEPAKAAAAFAEALRNAGENPDAAALLRLGGLTSAIELPLVNEQDLLNYARGLDALITGNNEQAQKILNNLGNEEITIGGILLRAPTELLSQYQLVTETNVSGEEKITESAPTLKTCYVVMGFGKKTDFETGRTVDLDRSYQDMIKPALEAAGLKCIRADEIVHSGFMDAPIYQLLLSADVVVVDLSTFNRNAFYQLGIRNALCPHTTIVSADLGGKIGGDEEELFRFLKMLIRTIITPAIDSPVYRALPHLKAPFIGKAPYQLNPLSLQMMGYANDNQRRCFVVQGSGKKIDSETGRTLDLDRSYNNMIKPAVEAAGLKCIRADKIADSNTTDMSNYAHLLAADVVIADISANNTHAMYALGVRHALRPYSTIVIAEDSIKVFPFDVKHAVVRQYHHSGEAIDPGEAKRFSGILTKAIISKLDAPSIDSPVYAALPNLQPAQVIDAAGENAEAEFTNYESPESGSSPSEESTSDHGTDRSKDSRRDSYDRSKGRGTTYVPGYRHDIFVSYACVDDLTISKGDQGWVTTLIAGLKIRLSQKLGRVVDIFLWMDEQLALNKPFSPEILQALTQSATLIIILSSGYKASNWCLKEMDSFWQSLTERANSRIFVVECDRLEIDEKPKVLQELLGYRFWVQDREGKSPRILGYPMPDSHERLYYDMLDDLAHDLAAELKQLKSLAENPAELQTQSDQRPTVFLAEVTDDLDTQRDRIYSSLDQEGFRVITAETSHFASYLVGNDKVGETIAGDLKNCTLFVQLLSGLTGKCRPGQLSFPALQYQTALEQGIPILQWRDPDLIMKTIGSTDHRALLQGDTVLAVGLEEFKQICIARLKLQVHKSKPATNSIMVFLNASPEDFVLAEAIGQVLKQHNIDYALPIRTNDPKLIQEDLELWLSECDALIIIYGPTSYTWARAQILRSRRIIALRDRPLKALALYEGPPEDKEHLGVGMMSLDGRRGLQESTLQPFLAALQSEKTKP